MDVDIVELATPVGLDAEVPGQPGRLSGIIPIDCNADLRGVAVENLYDFHRLCDDTGIFICHDATDPVRIGAKSLHRDLFGPARLGPRHRVLIDYRSEEHTTALHSL